MALLTDNNQIQSKIASAFPKYIVSYYIVKSQIQILLEIL